MLFNGLLSVTDADIKDDVQLPLLHESILHEALENGHYEDASKRIKSLTEDDLIKCYENRGGYSPPSCKSCLHIIAGLMDEQQAFRLCREFLSRIRKEENKNKLLTATVVEEFGINEIRERVRVAAIHIAAYHGNSGVVRLLCEKYGIDVNCSSERLDIVPPLRGITPLYWAATNGHTEVVKLLINIIGDVNRSCSDENDTALYIACQGGYLEIVKLLLAEQADVNAKTHMGATPLYIAAANGHEVVVQLLLENKADVNASLTNDGYTPLFIAAQNGHQVVVKLLLENKADVNASRHTGDTPLHVAAQNGHDVVVQLLLENKADQNATCLNGDRPFDVAQRRQHLHILKLLQ